MILEKQLIDKLFSLPIIESFKSCFAEELDNFFVVGGAVRDLLLEREINDIDLATKFTPSELMALCDSKRVKYKNLAANFGTIIIIIKGKALEITSFRKDINCNGRHAEVIFTRDLQEDSNRRDFTINSLYLNFLGNLIDPHNGVEDLAKKQLRFIGNSANRIKEDYLRILRLFRFYSTLDGFNIVEGALKHSIKLKENIKILSAERIKEELCKILQGSNNIEALLLLEKHHILVNIFTLTIEKITKLKSFQTLNSALKLPAIFKLAFFYQDSPKEEIEKLQKSLKLSRKESNFLSLLINNRLTIDSLDLRKNLFKFGKENFLNIFHYNLMFHEKPSSLYQKEMNLIKTLPIDIFPITGYDLQEKGFEGKEIGGKIALLQQVWLDSNMQLEKNELLEYV